MVGTFFWLEGLLGQLNGTPKSHHHVGQHWVGLNINGMGGEHCADMPIGEVIDQAEQLKWCVGCDLQ